MGQHSNRFKIYNSDINILRIFMLAFMRKYDSLELQEIDWLYCPSSIIGPRGEKEEMLNEQTKTRKLSLPFYRTLSHNHNQKDKKT